MELFSRIDLSKTNYKILECARILQKLDCNKLEDIYKKYCNYKKFAEPIPFSIDQYIRGNIDIIGYYDRKTLVAYSLMVKYPKENSVLSDQFAWNYHDPRLRLGIKSLEHECAFYKSLGYRYLYLGEHSEYKSKFQGYELLDKEICLQETT
jgi:hypothetical protein